MTVSPAHEPGVRCPACAGAELSVADDDAPATCPACGHRADPQLVAEAAWLRSERQRLDTRLTWVESQIAAGLTGASPLLPGTPPPRGTSLPGEPQPPASAQTLLLGGGALLLVIASVVFAAVAWGRLGAGGQVGLLLLVVAALASGAHGLRRTYRSTAQTLAAVAAAVAAVGLVAAPRLGLGAAWMREQGTAWTAVGLLAVAALGLLLGRLSGLRAWRLAAVCATVLSGLAAGLAASGDRGGPSPLAAGALAVVGAAVLLRADRSVSRAAGSAPTPAPTATSTDSTDLRLLGSGLMGVGVLLALSGYVDGPRYGLWAVCWALVAASTGALAWSRSASATGPQAASLAAGATAAHVPVFATGAAVATGLLGAHVPTAALGLLGAAALGTTTLPAARRRHLTGAAFAAALTLWVTGLPVIAAAAEQRSSTESGVGVGDVVTYLGVVAAALFVVAALDRQWLAWVGAAVATGAVWVALVDAGVDRLEAFTLPAATLLLVAGVVALLSAHRRPGARERPDRGALDRVGSLLVLGPALATALLPEAVVALEETLSRQPPVRSVAVIAVCVLVALAGALLRLRAPLLIGLVALAVAAVGQLVTVYDLLPRWVVLALGGALLLAAGFSFEALARGGRAASRYAGELR